MVLFIYFIYVIFYVLERALCTRCLAPSLENTATASSYLYNRRSFRISSFTFPNPNFFPCPFRFGCFGFVFIILLSLFPIPHIHITFVTSRHYLIPLSFSQWLFLAQTCRYCRVLSSSPRLSHFYFPIFIWVLFLLSFRPLPFLLSSYSTAILSSRHVSSATH